MDTHLTVIDHETGLVETEEVSQASQQFLSLLSDMGIVGSMLLQDQILMLKVPEEQQADVQDLYLQQPINFGKVNGKSLFIYGAAIFEHEAGEKKNGEIYPRYFQARILVELDGQPRIVKSAGASLLRHIAFMCRKHGWFKFDEPIEYTFIWEGPGQPHILDRVKKPSLEKH